MNDLIVELLLQTIPYPEQIMNLNTALENAVEFDWRGHHFKITNSFSVEELIQYGIYTAGSESELKQEYSKTDLSIMLEKFILERYQARSAKSIEREANGNEINIT